MIDSNYVQLGKYYLSLPLVAGSARVTCTRSISTHIPSKRERVVLSMPLENSELHWYCDAFCDEGRAN